MIEKANKVFYYRKNNNEIMHLIKKFTEEIEMKANFESEKL